VKLSNLAKRIRKAESLEFVDTPGSKTTKGACWGSKGDNYNVSLFRRKDFEQVTVADKIINTAVIRVCCEKLTVDNGKLSPMEPCQGNSRHTVCYHSLGYLKQKLAERGKQISFYEDILSALNGLNFGGQLTKVISKQGAGFVWAVVRDVTSKNAGLVVDGPIRVFATSDAVQLLSAKENINLMRGPEDDEGID
jgi:hypothetical protein